MANAYEQIRSISLGKELIYEGIFNRFRELEPAIGIVTGKQIGRAHV